jgi:hypothetical protein
MNKLILVGILTATPAVALAAQTLPRDPSFEIGARYWVSSGKTRWAHNAQDIEPMLGNPSSLLTYEGLGAQAVELHARKTLGDAWFIKGNVGGGWIKRGSFDDEDFLVGQIKFSDTMSSVRGNRLAYATLDAGRAISTSRDGRITLFAGYQEWTERADSYGLSFTVPAGAPGLDNNVPAVSNEVKWRSLRLGAGTTFVSGRTRVVAELALVPYTKLRNEDSHHLRTDPSDLGPVPNVINDGRGNGLQFDAEVRRAVFEHYELGLGFRYWKLRTTRGTNMAAGLSFPLVEMESERSGLTLSLTRSW